MSSINERIKTLVDSYYNGNVREFERACGLNKDTLKHVVGGRLSKPSFDSIELITRTIVQINPLWLITGEGDMENETTSSSSELIEELKAEINQLKGENRILREQIGLGERKDSNNNTRSA